MEKTTYIILSFLIIIIVLIVCCTAWYLKPVPRKYRDELAFLLVNTMEILNDSGVHYWLDYETLLGLIREGDLLAFDTDIDMCIMRDGVDYVMALQQKFIDRGLILTTSANNTLEVYRLSQAGRNTNGNCTDCYSVRIRIYEQVKDTMVRHCWATWPHPCYRGIIKDSVPADLLDQFVRIYAPEWRTWVQVPKRSRDLLEYRYGTNWWIKGAERQKNLRYGTF